MYNIYDPKYYSIPIENIPEHPMENDAPQSHHIHSPITNLHTWLVEVTQPVLSSRKFFPSI